MGCKGVGFFHAGPGGIEKPGDFGYRVDGEKSDQWQIALYCPKYGVCFQKIHQAPPDENGRTWQWDGNVEFPTITPSIGCDAKPRCGQHMVITAGIVTGTIPKKD